MKETLRILPMKALAALCLLTGLAPAWLLSGRYCLPDERLLWYLPPCLSALWGTMSVLFSGKKRIAFAALGIALLLAFGIIYLLPGGALRLLPLLPCLLMLLLLPPAMGRLVWEEWPAGAWVFGVFLHLVGQFLAGRPQWTGTAAPLSVSFALFGLLLLLALNRQGLREGMHGAQKAPALLRRRNLALVVGLYVPALLAACWGTLGQWLDQAWEAIKRGIVQAIAWLMGLFAQEETAVQSTEQGDGGLGMLPGVENAEPSLFAQIMEKVLLIIGSALLIAAFVFLCIFLFKRLRRLWKRVVAWLRRYAAAAGEDYVDEAESTLNLEEKAQALRGRLRKALLRPEKKTPWQELDGRGRVRRLYQQFLRKTPRAQALTAREALEKEMPPAQAAVFTELYERARYSDHDVFPQEADSLRQRMK